MSSGKFVLSSTKNVDQRAEQLQEFVEAIFPPTLRPWFISDESTGYDIFVDDEAEFLKRCALHYGLQLRPKHMSLPIWQLLDYLQCNRMR